MAKIRTFVISCSSDGDVDTRKLFVWGEMGEKTCLPITKWEAKKRVIQCQKKTKCQDCDYEIHEVIIERTAMTRLRALTK